MRRSIQAACLFVGVLSTSAASDLGRTDHWWRGYLANTVRCGVPLVADPSTAVQLPFWPGLEAEAQDVLSLEPGQRASLMEALMDAWGGDSLSAVQILRQQWEKQPGQLPSLWGTSLFLLWNPGKDSKEWIDAWLAWENKVYHPSVLVKGLKELVRSDPSAVVPLLKQAVQLYPEDRRFYPFLLLHPEIDPGLVDRLRDDRSETGGWSTTALRSLLDQDPSSRDLLLRAGYTAQNLDEAVSQDYGWHLRVAKSTQIADGAQFWDADGDGTAESTIVFNQNEPVTWTHRDDQTLWTLTFDHALPSRIEEHYQGAVWRLNFKRYPWLDSLSYQWGVHRVVYRYRSWSVQVPLWPDERFHGPAFALPGTLATLTAPVDPKSLVQQATSIESWEGKLRTDVAYLSRGQVWLQVSDENRDGIEDMWRYYRGGKLDSVYSEPDGRGEVTLREVYEKGRLKQVQHLSPASKTVDFVQFPMDGVQLWDTHGSGSPLQRLFTWSGTDKLAVMVFSGKSLPWNSMPTWEPRP